MAEKKKDIYIEEYESGMSYSEIARKHDVSRQCVHQACTAKRHYKIKPEGCIFENLRNWMNEQHISKAQLSEMTGSSYPSLDRYLKGDSDVPKRFIDKMIDLTGMNYETLFSIG